MKKLLAVFLTILFVFNLISAALAFTVDDEVKIGKEAALKVEKEYKVLTDDKYQGRINYIGKFLYAVCPKKELPYTFKVIESEVFNAMCLPGGFIYVTSALMDKCNDGEVAFVMGHEMAHAAHSHQLKQAEKNTGATLGILAIALILTKGSLSGGTMNTVALANSVLTSSYSRADEQQADLDSLSYMAGAGYDPNYAVSAFQKMKENGEELPGFLNTIVGSHPLTDDRIKYVQNKIPEIGFIYKPSDPFPPFGADLTGKGYNYTAKKTTGDNAKEIKPVTKIESYKEAFYTLEDKNKDKPKIKEAIIPEGSYKNYRDIPYGSLSKNDFINSGVLPNWENTFYNFLKNDCHFIGKFTRDRKLDNKARILSLKKTERNITSKYVLYADIIPENMGYYDYEESFYNYDLNKILALSKTFDRVGLSIKLLPDNRKYIVIVFEYSPAGK